MGMKPRPRVLLACRPVPAPPGWPDRDGGWVWPVWARARVSVKGKVRYVPYVTGWSVVVSAANAIDPKKLDAYREGAEDFFGEAFDARCDLREVWVGVRGREGIPREA